MRPSARRIREALFDFLDARIANTRFLDLCAGSGAVGIETLSRGAAHATFVDRSEEACDVIESNLTRCGVTADRAEIVSSSAEQFLQRVAGCGGGEWDIAYFDPPYHSEYDPALLIFATGAVLKCKGRVLIAEHHYENKLKDTVGAMRRWRIIEQGRPCLSFYEQRSNYR